MTEFPAGGENSPTGRLSGHLGNAALRGAAFEEVDCRCFRSISGRTGLEQEPHLKRTG